MPHLLTPRLLSDLPLDQPGDRAEFNFHEYADTFARLIADPGTRTPLVIGMSGKWGSGKTTLLRTLQAKLDELRDHDRDRTKPTKYSFISDDDTDANFRRCRTVWFNAWKYADEDELLVALVRVIVQTMADDDAVSKILAKALDPTYPRRDVVATVLSWFAIKLPGEVEVGINTGTPKETPFAQKTAMLDLFMETFDRLMAVWVSGNLFDQKLDPQRGVVAVFIDDLDRCLPDKAVQVLEAIKLFLDRPGVVFVLAADADAIHSAIKAHYEKLNITDQRAADYLEKIFQVRFALPPLSTPQVQGYLDAGLHVQDEKLRQSVELILAGAGANPRQIKTFINDLEVGWAMLTNSGQAEGVEKEDFVRWLALNRVSPPFCEKVRDLLPDRRLDYLRDASQWAKDPTHKPGEYDEQWGSADHRKLREVLKVLVFTPKVTPDMLEGFIFWSGLAELEARRKAEEAAKQRQVEQQQAEESERQWLAELAALRRVEEAETLAQVNREAPITRGDVTRGEAVKGIQAGEYWITISAGKFVMGSRDDDKEGNDNERPQHAVDIPYAYRIARYPVTNAEFAMFVEVTGHKSQAANQELPDHPVVKVSWHDTQAYCKWLTEQLRADSTISADEIARLPNEAEWEKAARGEYGKKYPWGDEWDASKCNSRESNIGTTTPVGKYSPQGDSPYGVADMAGNVWEWTASLYEPYPYKPGYERNDPDAGGIRVLRGGSFGDSRGYARCASRAYVHPDGRSGYFGFRVVVSPGSRF